MFWVWTVSLPVTILNSPAVTRFPQPKFGTGEDIAGIVLWSVGFIMESVSDIQKYRFRTAHGSDGAVCDVGFFAWTRHPNYFGEIIIQFGMQEDCVYKREYVLNQCRHFHHGGVSRSKGIRHWRPLSRTLCFHSRSHIFDNSAHVCVWIDSAGTAGSKEALREGHKLGGIRKISSTNQHSDPIPTPIVRPNADFSETHDFPGISNLRV